jgi:hypothetical protein
MAISTVWSTAIAGSSNSMVRSPQWLPSPASLPQWKGKEQEMNRRKFLATTSVVLSGAVARRATACSLEDRQGADGPQNDRWELSVEQPNRASIRLITFALPLGGELKISKELDGLTATATVRREANYWVLTATAGARNEGRSCYFRLSRGYGPDSTPMNFNGPVRESNVFRQSPHNPLNHHFNTQDMQAMPLVAVENASKLEIAICDTPAHFDNYTTQTYDLQQQRVALSSGDDSLAWNLLEQRFQGTSGQQSGSPDQRAPIAAHYFSVAAGQEHRMEAILLTVPRNSHQQIPLLANQAVAQHWSQGKIKDLLGATFFSSAYMNLRVNETGHSRYWVVPSIEYSNKQYSRDAFWISMVLPPEYSQSCFENESANDTQFTGAERQLFTLLWAYRSSKSGNKIDKQRVERILRIVESHAPNSYYRGFTETPANPGCFQGWADLVAFDSDDTIANNQGLFAVALLCMEALGIETKLEAEDAIAHYQNLFNPAIQAYPISLKRREIAAVDPLMGELLAQVYLRRAFLPTEHVLSHYETLKKGRTDYGFKVFCRPDGAFLLSDQYRCADFKSPLSNRADGSYLRGGSWYLYDMQMLMAAYLHGAKDAEDLMIWRTKIELLRDGTTNEYIDTVEGEANKPNMGWNAAVYGIWSELIRQGRASDRLFREIDRMRTQF